MAFASDDIVELERKSDFVSCLRLGGFVFTNPVPFHTVAMLAQKLIARGTRANT